MSLADENIAAIADRFKTIMLVVGLPGVSDEDSITIDSRNWEPTIIHSDQEWDFWDAGSGDKKTLFNVCYALAVLAPYHWSTSFARSRLSAPVQCEAKPAPSHNRIGPNNRLCPWSRLAHDHWRRCLSWTSFDASKAGYRLEKTPSLDHIIYGRIGAQVVGRRFLSGRYDLPLSPDCAKQ